MVSIVCMNEKEEGSSKLSKPLDQKVGLDYLVRTEKGRLNAY